MTARPLISALPSAGLSVDGIVDVLGGKSIAYPFTVGSTNNYVLKGQALEADGADGSVKYAAQNATYDNFRGVAITSALQGDDATVLRHGIVRMVYGTVTNLVVGAGVAVWGFGKVCAVGQLGEDEAELATDNVIGYVSEVGSGYVDVEINMFSEEQTEYSDSSNLSVSSTSVSSESSNSSDSSVSSVSSESSSESKSSVSSESSSESKLSVSSESSNSSESSISSLSSESSNSSESSISSLSSESSNSSESSTSVP